jgi:hypothetical protein
MTLPWQVLSDCNYMITRRCSERRLISRPDVVPDGLGLSARRDKVDISFSVAISETVAILAIRKDICRLEGPAIGLLRIADRHPRVIRENLKSAA